jgi:hypothetical protein
MLVQIAFLGESQVAVQLALVRAYERPFLCVDSQVVIKVVPFSEVHGTTWEITLQDLQESLGLWVLELEDSE